MKKYGYLLILVTLLCSCHSRATFTLKGDIPSLGNDTVLVFGVNEWFDRIDTVAVHHGRFRFSFAPDTITPLWVLFSNGHREYIFAEKHTATTLTGDTAMAGALTIEGGTQNALLQEFETMVRDTVLPLKKIQQLADTFIMRHPFDEASIRILQEYLVEVPDINPSDIRAAISYLSGNLQDNPYIVDLRPRINRVRGNTNSIVLSNYHLRTPDGQHIDTSCFRDTCLLLTFWASWDKESRIRQEEYRALADTFAGRRFAIIGISLDNNREAWTRAIEEDSLTWTQGNNFQGWNLDMIQRFGITRLPANVLLNGQRRAQAFDLKGDELKEKVREVVGREEERIKEEEKAEKERLRNEKKKKR